ELIAQYVCRLLNHMQSNGFDTCVPRLGDEAMSREPAVDLTSGYIQRAAAILPKQGDKQPWKSYQNYARDLMMLKFGTLADSAMQFERRAQPTGAAQPA
ncbi:MAG: FAD-containing monooxygenase EthA, partial [Ralstonia pickettii]|nr:FAD-containing monooxygenase EthA [Ralstonia pickettii]